MTERSERSKMSKALSALSCGEACGARWTLGALLLAPLAAANSSYCAVPAVMLLAIFITIASKWSECFFFSSIRYLEKLDITNFTHVTYVSSVSSICIECAT